MSRAKRRAMSEVTDCTCVDPPGAMISPMYFSLGSHSSAVATASVTASGGSVTPTRCAASRSRKPSTACTAAATSSASVLEKYR